MGVKLFVMKEAIVMPQIYRFPWGVREDAQVVVLEYGSKSTPLIANVCRELGVCTWSIYASEFDAYTQRFLPKAVILSGGPDSVYDPDATSIPPRLMDLHRNHGTAIFGICYGAQALVHAFGGRVEKGTYPEIGITRLSLVQGSLGGYGGGDVVMNHGDEIVSLPFEWKHWGSTKQYTYALFGKGNLLGALFHPEMDHTVGGRELLAYFLFRIGRCAQDHIGGEEAFVSGVIAFIHETVQRGGVFAGVSGGVDSVVTLKLLQFALGIERVCGIHVDNGFLREGETEEVRRFLGEEGMIYIDVRVQFWNAIERIPWNGNIMSAQDTRGYFSQLRKVIGETFIHVFEGAAAGRSGTTFLAQGTNCSDIQETKTGFVRHHNVGGLPERMELDVIEPLAGLYKWEIRLLAAYLGLDPEIVWRQPSPGPGNALRMWPPVRRECAVMLGGANRILEELIRLHYPDHRDRPSQYFVGLLPGLRRGLVGDEMVYGAMLGIRAVKTDSRENYATVKGFHFAPEVWSDIEMHLRAEVQMPDGIPVIGVSLDPSSKPSAGVEWH